MFDWLFRGGCKSPFHSHSWPKWELWEMKGIRHRVTNGEKQAVPFSKMFQKRSCENCGWTQYRLLING